MAFKLKNWMKWTAAAVVIVVLIVVSVGSSAVPAVSGCPGSQVYCPGVGCLSGADKCQPGNPGGASKVFSKETFAQAPKMKTCRGGTRTDGPCLLDFPDA